MFDLYQGPETAAHHQAELLEAVAADRRARAASDADQPSSVGHQSPVARLTILIADARAVLSEAVAAATRRPRWS